MGWSRWSTWSSTQAAAARASAAAALVGASYDRLGEFEVPVAEGMPDELVERVRGLVEAVLLDTGAHPCLEARDLAHDPAVDGLAAPGRVELRVGGAPVDLAEARGVPQLGGEVAVALDPLGRQLDVAALGGLGREGEAERVGAVIRDQRQGIDDVALGLRHLLALLVAHEGVDVDVVEGARGP